MITLTLFVRITIMQTLVVFGGILARLSNSYRVALILLIILKSVFDTKTHNKQYGLTF